MLNALGKRSRYGLLAAIMLILAGCGGPDHAVLGPETTSTTTQGAASGATGIVNPEGNPSNGTSGGASGAGSNAGGGGAASGTGTGTAAGDAGGSGSGSGSGSAVVPGPARANLSGSGAAASAAIDTYLKGIVARDTGAVARSSTGGPAALGRLRLVIADINQQQGGTTKAHTEGDSLAPQSTTSSSVTFGGSVQLVTDVTGSKGNQHTAATFGGPFVVSMDSGAWKVRSFTYDGKPMKFYDEHASQAIGGLHFNVDFLLSYGNTMNALITLTDDSGRVDPASSLGDARLTAGAGTAAKTGAVFLPGNAPTGLLFFPPTADTPSRLTATIKRADNSTVDYSIPLTAQPS